MNPLRIGTRGSKLALAQATWVMEQCKGSRPVELKVIETRGDRGDSPALGDGIFVKEIQRSLLAGSVDATVHSLKDVPTEPTAGLIVAAVTGRWDAREAIVGGTLAGLPEGARIGTGSPRRSAQIKRLRPDLEVVPIKGNVPTRISRIGRGECDAVLLAAAGLMRLGIEADEILDFDKMLPAPGQGALLVEVRDRDEDAASTFAGLHDAETRDCVVAERVVLRELGGGCLLPVAAYASVQDGDLVLRASVTSADGSQHLESEARGKASKPLGVAKRVVRDLIRRGARELLT